MALARCAFLVCLYTAVLCSVSCVKIFPLDGTSVTLASGFNVKPSPVVPQDFTSATPADAAARPSLPPQILATCESKTEIPTLARFQSAPAVAESVPHTIIPITLTITPTPLLSAVRIQPSTTEVEMAGAIAPTSVKASATTTFEVPAVDLLPPKKPQNLIQDS